LPSTASLVANQGGNVVLVIEGRESLQGVKEAG
jgi:hypothetical protein